MTSIDPRKEVNAGIISELQNLSPSAIIELFELQLKNNLHGSNDVYYFHSGSSLNLNSKIKWNGNDYLRFPIEASGFEYTGGKLPRPKLTVSNATGLITSLLLQVNQVTAGNDLIGAILTRKRTLARFLPNDNFVGDNPSGAVDETAEFPREIYIVARKSTENRLFVEFELAAPLDLENIKAPKRICTKKNFPSIGTFIQ
tara:strand:+ start:618 stop:1217 length:600 start_codon:yes stop_codon:yes gene_type:complete